MKSSVWNKIVLPVLFTIAIALGLAQGDSFVSAVTGDFLPTSYIINNTSYNNIQLRAVYSNPVLQNIVETESGTTEYIWEVPVTIGVPFGGDIGYYNVYCTTSFSMEYPSNCTVVQTGINNYESQDGFNVSLYSYSHSSAGHKINAYFRSMAQNKYIATSNSYRYNLVTFNLNLVTQSNTQPNLSFTNISSAIRFTNDMSYEELITEAIENSDTATDIADILTNSGLTLEQVRNIATALGVANNHLTQIQEYAFYIWEILNSELSAKTDTDFANAETKVEDIVDNMQQYNPSKPNSQTIQSDAQNRYMQLQLEEQNDSIFFYLNWAYLLPILLLVFTFAILSYILYGGK